MDNLIKIIIGETLVMGVITLRTNRDIVVEIIEPYKGFYDCRHIPCFATPEKDYTGEYGITVAKQLLNQVYTICKEVDEITFKRKDVIRELNVLTNEYRNKINENRKFKSSQKRIFRDGLITQTQYQNSLRKKYRESIDMNMKLSNFFEEKIQPFFSVRITFSMRDIVIDFIEDLPM